MASNWDNATKGKTCKTLDGCRVCHSGRMPCLGPERTARDYKLEPPTTGIQCASIEAGSHAHCGRWARCDCRGPGREEIKTLRRLLPSCARNLLASRLFLYLRDFVRPLRRGGRVSESFRAAAGRPGGVARTRRNCGNAIAAHLFQFPQ